MSSSKSESRNSTWYLPDRPVVAEDHLAVPQPAHHLGEVLHLRGGDRRHPERLVHRRDAAADAEREAPAGQPVHRGRPRPGDERMARVVIGRRRGDLHPGGDRAGRPGQRRRLLDVPPLGDERGAEAQLLAAAGLVQQAAGPSPQRRRAGSSRARRAAASVIARSLLVAVVPYVGDPAVNHAEDLDAADIGHGAVIPRHRRW